MRKSHKTAGCCVFQKTNHDNLARMTITLHFQQLVLHERRHLSRKSRRQFISFYTLASDRQVVYLADCFGLLDSYPTRRCRLYNGGFPEWIREGQITVKQKWNPVVIHSKFIFDNIFNFVLWVKVFYSFFLRHFVSSCCRASQPTKEHDWEQHVWRRAWRCGSGQRLRSISGTLKTLYCTLCHQSRQSV